MPDYKVYVPEAKAAVLYQYKEQFGKGGSGMIVGFMENAVGGAREGPVPIDEVYHTYFGDIENERQFLSLFSDRQSAETAILNRSADLFSKHPDIYTDVIAQFKKNHPKFAKIKGV
ncbi:hypothetical protein [uncultured Methanocorpusculum sp.]|nr:hypothetical protein [uncultured Methanocorpusculum sp.]